VYSSPEMRKPRLLQSSWQKATVMKVKFEVD
jgi:hypothetical protein